MNEQWFKVSLLEMWWLLEKPVNKEKTRMALKKAVEQSQNGSLDQRGLHQFLHQEAEGGWRRLGRIDWIRHKRMKTETLR